MRIRRRLARDGGCHAGRGKPPPLRQGRRLAQGTDGSADGAGRILRLALGGSLRMTGGEAGADSPGVDDEGEPVMPPTNGRRYGEAAPLSRFATALPDAGRARGRWNEDFPDAGRARGR